MALPWPKLFVRSFIFLEEKGKDERGRKSGETSSVKVRPCYGAGDVPRMPFVLPSVHSSSPPKFSHPPNTDNYSAELGDTGERSWWLDLIQPSAEGREKGGWITHKTPPRAVDTSTHNAFKH